MTRKSVLSGCLGGVDRDGTNPGEIDMATDVKSVEVGARDAASIIFRVARGIRAGMLVTARSRGPGEIVVGPTRRSGLGVVVSSTWRCLLSCVYGHEDTAFFLRRMVFPIMLLVRRQRVVSCGEAYGCGIGEAASCRQERG